MSTGRGALHSFDNVLVIEIPDGYEVISASPDFDKREETQLIWDGSLHRNFDRGEPALVLERQSTGLGIWILAMGVLFACALVV